MDKKENYSSDEWVQYLENRCEFLENTVETVKKERDDIQQRLDTLSNEYESSLKLTREQNKKLLQSKKLYDELVLKIEKHKDEISELKKKIPVLRPSPN